MTQPCVRSLAWIAISAGLFASVATSIGAEPKTDKTRRQLLQLHNKERKAAGLEPLAQNAELTKAAQEYAEFLTSSDEFSHTAKGTPRSRVTDAGYKASAVGENIAIGQKTPAEVVEGWMESKTHKDNILREDYSEVGFGIATDEKGRIIWVVDFGDP